MEITQLNDGILISITLFWVLFQCGSLMLMSKWLRPGENSSPQSGSGNREFIR